MKPIVLFRLTLIICFAGNIGWCLAADNILSPETIPLVKYLYALGLSFWGGMAAFLQRFAAGTEVGKWFVLLGRDTISSTLAGILTFLLATHFAVPPLLAAVGVSIAGYGGSRALEIYFNKLAKKVDEQ